MMANSKYDALILCGPSGVKKLLYWDDDLVDYHFRTPAQMENVIQKISSYAIHLVSVNLCK